MGKRGDQTLRWSWGEWRFVWQTASSFIVIFRGEGVMAVEEPRETTLRMQLAFEVWCVEWMISTVPDGIGAKIPDLNY